MEGRQALAILHLIMVPLQKLGEESLEEALPKRKKLQWVKPPSLRDVTS